MELAFLKSTRLIWTAFFMMLVASAHAEQTRMVGQFQRGDGTTIRAFEMDLDGVIGFVGFQCWFELPDGMAIRKPKTSREETGSCVVSISDTGADIYNFPFSARWFPVANQVLRFDGYRFTQDTTSWKYWASPFVHTSYYFIGYLMALGIFTPFLIFGVWLVKRTPIHRWWMLLRVIWVLIGVFIAVVFGLFMAIYGPYSLGAWLLLSVIYFLLYLKLRRFLLVMSMKRSS